MTLPMLFMILDIVRESFEGFINSEASACLGCQRSVLHSFQAVENAMILVFSFFPLAPCCVRCDWLVK